MKRCVRCGELKPLEEFCRDKRAKDGLFSSCRECGRRAMKERRIKENDIVNKNRRKWRSQNAEHCRDRDRERYHTKEKHSPEWKKKHTLFVMQWKRKNPEAVRAINRRHDEKSRITARGKLSHAMSRNINSSIRRGSKGGRKWEMLVGYTTDQLKRHLERKFTPDMSWDNYGSYWHIDHRIPESAFNFDTPDDIDFKRCWALKNLQPLEAKKNMIKGAKVDRPFQPSLTIQAYEERV